ncbi:MAG: NAD-dependent epimerase/dehydratase family protein [PVC group bacterium]|nr:NAD-dependent epimerase/dehydratase family protein [Desulfobacteraceae bacterium]MCP4060534.1 NAD-dependent epimerase/dehydratase family protein [Pseudoalteromonas sp.]MCP4651388.1 NAD-dependent epimerase/dehydratase family protein [PVC group bacterium]
MNRVLILGGNGYIGGALASNLMARGYHVTVVSRSDVSNVVCHQYIQLDLAESDAYKSLNLDEIDTVIDLVSYIPPNTENITIFDIKRSLESYGNLLKHINDKRYLFFSSGGTVYGDSSTPLSESAALKPVSPYGIQKCIQEELILKLMPKGVIMRVTNPYGGNQQVKHGVGFVGHLLNCYARDKILTLTVPECTTRDYIDLRDLMIITAALIERSSIGVEVFNISSGKATSLKQLIASLCSDFSSNVNSDLSRFIEKSHISSNVLINEKVKIALNIEINHSVIDYIKRKSKEYDEFKSSLGGI